MVGSLQRLEDGVHFFGDRFQHILELRFRFDESDALVADVFESGCDVDLLGACVCVRRQRQQLITVSDGRPSGETTSD